MRHKYISLWPLLIPLILLFPGLNAFPYTSAGAVYSDLTISHYPNAYFLKQSIITDHTIPLWSPTILGGYPFAADPLAGLWYPLGLLALLFPLPLGFNLVLCMHLIIGGLGMYQLLRQEGVEHLPALFGAIAFESMPKWFAHYGAGHLTMLYAVSWTPWLLVLRNRKDAYALSEITSQLKQIAYRCWFIFTQPGVILALIFLADPRWAPYAGLLWIIYNITHSQLINSHKQESKNTHSHNDNQQTNKSTVAYSRSVFIRIILVNVRSWIDSLIQWLKNLKKPIGYLIKQIVITVLLSAPLSLPLIEYTRLSTRSYLKPEDILAFSLPWERLLGLFFPTFGDLQEWVIYPGGVILTLAFFALILKNYRVRKYFWVIIIIVSILYSLGSNLSFMSSIVNLPGINLLRVPTRALFLTGLAFAVLASFGLDRLLQGLESVEFKRAGLYITGLVAFVSLLTGIVFVITKKFSLNFSWGTIIILFTVIWFGLVPRIIPQRIWMAGFFVIALLDFAVVDLGSYSPRSTALVISEGEDVARYITTNPIILGKPQPDLKILTSELLNPIFRVYSPSYSIPQQIGVRYQLELADGVDPLQLKAYKDFLEKASGIPNKDYSVTLPPFPGDPRSINASFTPDPKLMGLLNVGYIASEFDLNVPGLEKVGQFDQTRVYKNTEFLPRAWVTHVGSLQELTLSGSPTITQIPVIDQFKPNKVTLNTTGPGVLVLSEINYPGWQVWINGKRCEIQPVLGLFRGVELNAGQQEVVFVFRPYSVYFGLFLAIVGIGYLIGDIFYGRKYAS